MREREKAPDSRRNGGEQNRGGADVSLHPAWAAFVRHCEELGHGEIEKLKIQDGLPILAEVSRRKIKFS